MTYTQGAMRNMATNKNTKKAVAVIESASEAVPVEFIGTGDAVAGFIATLQQEGNTLASRVAIVTEFRAANPAQSGSKCYAALQDALESALGDNSRKYTGFKRATLERLDTIGQVIARHGWTLDGPTSHALWTLLEKNRPAVRALLEARKTAPGKLETLYSATEKAAQQKVADSKEATRKARALQKDIESGKVNPDAITPAALVASIRERVGKQTWSTDEVATFVANLTAYTEALTADILTPAE